MPGFPIVLNGGLQVEPAPDVGDPHKPGKARRYTDKEKAKRLARKAGPTKERIIGSR